MLILIEIVLLAIIILSILNYFMNKRVARERCSSCKYRKVCHSEDIKCHMYVREVKNEI